MILLCTHTGMHKRQGQDSESLTWERPGKESYALGGAVPVGFLEEAGSGAGEGEKNKRSEQKARTRTQREGHVRDQRWAVGVTGMRGQRRMRA